MPKQFLRLVSDYSLFQSTLLRSTTKAGFAAPVIICNADHRFIVVQQLEEIGVQADAIILEPDGRNTAPAAALACLHALANKRTDPLLLLPADHTIANEASFLKAVDGATRGVEIGRIMTFGIIPEYPETGYGYIRSGTEISGAPKCFEVERFVEKPDLATATAYVHDGGYFWNSGMFLFSPTQFLAELEDNQPEVVTLCRKAMDARRNELQFTWPDAGAFRRIRSASVDRAVMEHSNAAGVIPVDMGWNDVGSWRALQRHNGAPEGNTMIGDTVQLESSGSYLRSESRLVTGIGLRDMIVVETPDAVLVAPRQKSDHIKTLVKELNSQNRMETVAHTKTVRPWGTFQTVAKGLGFQVKELVVSPRAQLSLQRHRHRAEHWVVISGQAEITINNKVSQLGAQQSVDIPVGAVHRLANRAATPLRVVEVSFGSYLGEDDIERLEDDYGRVGVNDPSRT